MSERNEIPHEDLSRPKTPFDLLRLFFSGFAMGSADIVPGVSGGTMAFILGIYETLLDAIKSVDLDVIRMVFKFDIKGIFEHIPFRFLIALGAGIMTAVLMLSSLLHHLLKDEPTFIFAFFAGLIIASILAIGVKVKWEIASLVAFLLAAAFAFYIVGFDAAEVDPIGDLSTAIEDSADVSIAQAELIMRLESAKYENTEPQVDTLISGLQAGDDMKVLKNEMQDALDSDYEAADPITLFFSGMLAICAMILPGISGSFILLIIGQYEHVLGAVKNFDIISVAAVGAGAAIGIIAFSRIISWLLKHYENLTVAALVGFMTGSMRLIYSEASKGVDVVSETGSLSAGQVAFVIILIAVGFILVSLLDHMQSRSNPVFAWIWKPGPKIDSISEKASALD